LQNGLWRRPSDGKLESSLRKPPLVLGPIVDFLALIDFWRIQVQSFGQPGRTARPPENEGGLLVIAYCPDIGDGNHSFCCTLAKCTTLASFHVRC